jgi:hypothetical protein
MQFVKLVFVLCRSRLGTVQPGVICAVESSTDVFHRVRIEFIVTKDPSGNAVTVQVKSLDEGWKCNFKVCILYIFFLYL